MRRRFVGIKILIGLVATTGLSFAAAVECHAQERLPDDVVPPPLVKLDKATKDALGREKSLKSRVKLAIKVMDTRLMASSAAAKTKDFDKSLKEISFFQALLDDTHGKLQLDTSRRALRNNKRFEIALRGFIPELEKLRRTLPYSHGFHVRRLIKNVKEVREALVDSFYSDDIL